MNQSIDRARLLRDAPPIVLTALVAVDSNDALAQQIHPSSLGFDDTDKVAAGLRARDVS
jgi:hypothetical protein